MCKYIWYNGRYVRGNIFGIKAVKGGQSVTLPLCKFDKLSQRTSVPR